MNAKTPKFDKALIELKKLGLPADGFTVCGGGALAARKIRDIGDDIDIIVTERLKERLLKHPKAVEKYGKDVFQIGPLEIAADCWLPGVSPKEMIDNSEAIGGIRYVRLEDIVKWKEFKRRDKDLNDIKLIEKYLESGRRCGVVTKEK